LDACEVAVVEFGAALNIRPILLALLTSAACSGPPQPQAQTSAATNPPPRAEAPSKNEAASRADALVEDLERRKAAQAKFDRENPAPVASPIIIPAPQSPRAPTAAPVVAARPPNTNAPAPIQAPAAAAAAPARDEAWWKQERRRLQEILDAAQVQLAEAEKLNFKYGYNDAQAEYKKRAAAVAAARNAIDQLHEDARRAGVPPAWLR
jgi:hypothetical protein